MSLNFRPDEALPDQRPVPINAPSLRGHVEPGTLASTVSADYPHLLPAPAQDAPSFVDTALDLLRPFAGPDANGVVVLVSVKFPRKMGEALGFTPAPAFRMIPVERLVGRIFVVSNILTQGFSYPLVPEEDVDVPSILFRLAALGLGECPALIADLALGSATWCPGGAYDDSRLDQIPLIEDGACGPTNAITVLAEIDRVATGWRVGGVMPPIWEDEQLFVVAADAEKQLAETLYPALRQRFINTHRVHVEYNVVKGRNDLTLAALPGAGASDSWMVGVDVVGSYRAAPRGVIGPLPMPKAANEETLRKGLEATEEYRRLMPGAHPICCAFDMQEDDDGGALVSRIAEEARLRDVEMRRWLVPNRARPSQAA